MNTVDMFMKQLASDDWIEQREGYPRSHCQTGHRYNSFPGRWNSNPAEWFKREGEATEWATDPHMLFAAAYSAITLRALNEAVDGKAVIYWREKPKVYVYDMFTFESHTSGKIAPPPGKTAVDEDIFEWVRTRVNGVTMYTLYMRLAIVPAGTPELFDINGNNIGERK
jgi:hypothetical protein